MDTIRNPIEWSRDQLAHAARAADRAAHAIRGEQMSPQQVAIRRIGMTDLRAALSDGLDDFRTFRTDVAFLCIVYPLVGLALVWFSFHLALLPLVFPLASGFALIGPVAAIGLYEMSRRREKGEPVSWADGFGMVSSPSFGAMLVLGLALLVVFLLWLGVAQAIYVATLGPEPPASVTAFLRDVFTTGMGWAMIVIGLAAGFVFAVAVLMISAVSFPMLIDRDVGLATAVVTSVRAVQANPVPMAAWGMIVAGGLVLGMIPLFLGLTVVLPVLGHATWHLYRRLVA